jgi:hypothetical protein
MYDIGEKPGKGTYCSPIAIGKLLSMTIATGYRPAAVAAGDRIPLMKNVNFRLKRERACCPPLLIAIITIDFSSEVAHIK